MEAFLTTQGHASRSLAHRAEMEGQGVGESLSRLLEMGWSPWSPWSLVSPPSSAADNDLWTNASKPLRQRKRAGRKDIACGAADMAEAVNQAET